MRLRLFRRDRGAGFVGRLSRVVSDQPELHALLASQRERMHHLIIKIESVAGVNGGALLVRVHFVHLKRRDRSRFVLG